MLDWRGLLHLSVLPGTLEAADRDLRLNSSVYYSWAGPGPHYRHFNINYMRGQRGPFSTVKYSIER